MSSPHPHLRRADAPSEHRSESVSTDSRLATAINSVALGRAGHSLYHPGGGPSGEMSRASTLSGPGTPTPDVGTYAPAQAVGVMTADAVHAGAAPPFGGAGASTPSPVLASPVRRRHDPTRVISLGESEDGSVSFSPAEPRITPTPPTLSYEMPGLPAHHEESAGAWEGAYPPRDLVPEAETASLEDSFYGEPQNSSFYQEHPNFPAINPDAMDASSDLTVDAGGEMEQDQDEHEQENGNENDEYEYSIYLPTDPQRIAAICRFDVGLENWFPPALEGREDENPSSLTLAAQALAQRRPQGSVPTRPSPLRRLHHRAQPLPRRPKLVDEQLPAPLGVKEQNRTRHQARLHAALSLAEDEMHCVRPVSRGGKLNWDKDLDTFFRPNQTQGRADEYFLLARIYRLEQLAELERAQALRALIPVHRKEGLPRASSLTRNSTMGSDQSVQDVLASFGSAPSRSALGHAVPAHKHSSTSGKTLTDSGSHLNSSSMASKVGGPHELFSNLSSHRGSRPKRPRPPPEGDAAGTVASPNTRPRARQRHFPPPLPGTRSVEDTDLYNGWGSAESRTRARQAAQLAQPVRWVAPIFPFRDASDTQRIPSLPPARDTSFGLSDLLGFGPLACPGRVGPEGEFGPKKMRQVLLSHLD